MAGLTWLLFDLAIGRLSVTQVCALRISLSVIGEVRLAANVSVWFGAMQCGDAEPIIVVEPDLSDLESAH
ncbi:hypothetical protein [Burkholderia sp. AW49-1]